MNLDKTYTTLYVSVEWERFIFLRITIYPLLICGLYSGRFTKQKWAENVTL